MEITLEQLSKIYKQMMILSEIPVDNGHLKELTEKFERDCRRMQDKDSRYSLVNFLINSFEPRVSLYKSRLTGA